MSIDPVTTDADTGGSFNRYVYAENSPYVYIDPDGRFVETAADVASIAFSYKIYRKDPSFINGAALSIDGVAAAVPFVPGGIGTVRTILSKSEQLIANKAAGKTGELGTRLDNAGKIIGEQVSIITSTGKRTVSDFLTKVGEKLGVVETKTGNARLTKGQAQLLDDIKNGRAVTPVGKNAEAAGLDPGKKILIDDHKVDRR